MTAFGREEAAALLAEKFAPWIQELGIVFVEVGPERVLARLPNSPRLARVGGMICGQALMALADTLMVFAVAARNGAFIDMATVGQSISFYRAAAGAELLCEVTIARMGRSLAFGHARMYLDGRPAEPVAEATITYALAGPR
ncbi:MAG: PaaI family thioesterase [Alphaproteobacteria bacterium]|nr:PaaI family thioesterase [Alphaproteobacteria bacterium]